MKTIIVPTDFSSTSINAAYYAVELARRIDADIMLLHVLSLPITVSEVPLPPDSYECSIEEAKNALKDLRDKLDNYSNNKLCITFKVSTGSFLGEIESFNSRKNVFAMIMGTSGAGATEAFFLGSFCQAAARHLSQPVIIIPPGYRFKGIHKVTLACDMRNVSETVPSSFIKDFVKHFDAKLEVLYVSRPSEKMYPNVLSETKVIQNNLASQHPEIRIATNDDTQVGLDDFVLKSDTDLLIMIHKERNFVAQLFHKSVSRKVISHPKVPVMIVHN